MDAAEQTEQLQLQLHTLLASVCLGHRYSNPICTSASKLFLSPHLMLRRSVIASFSQFD